MSMAEAARGNDPAPVFAALGDRTRLSLLMRLSDGVTRSITMLSSDTSLTRQAVTKHLRVLEDAGLVECVRHGRERRFGCRLEPLDEARAYLDRVSRQWDDALGRLKAFVEK
ncbi:ArsR family transcriptional regulator [Sphingomonas sp. Root710]|uniref:ArsR/SmtB family transcription factor n=1 Tax=Sphingomonas sp. Root710 TaxID=1736594 RepID=UPI0006F4912C|nr:winged helix-turn-helix domain-containing protein [Sphingomonas sp. Root710]KRB85701.1 ArsR family transcriptional regulator [Sphingomonas sp. Root710]